MGTHAGMRGRDGKVRRRYFMAKYVMALDAGTTSNRCILFNEKGEICSMAQKEFTQYYPQPGWVEHDASEIWQTQLSVARIAMQNVGATYKDIAAIGITNQRSLPSASLTSVKLLSYGISRQDSPSTTQSCGSAAELLI